MAAALLLLLAPAATLFRSCERIAPSTRCLRMAYFDYPIPGTEVKLPAAFALSPDWATLAAGSHDARTASTTWSLGEEALLHRLPDAADRITSVVFSPTGTAFATLHTSGISVWDTQSGKLTTSIPKRAVSLAFSPSGHRIAIGSDDGVQVRDAAVGTPLLELLHSSVVVGVAFSPDGALLATAGLGGVRIWSAMGGHLLLHLATPGMQVISAAETSVQMLAFSPDGSRLAAAVDAKEHSAVHIWELRGTNAGIAEAQPPQLIPAIPRSLGALRFSSDGSLLAAGGIGPAGIGHTTLWRVSTGEHILSVQGHALGVCGIFFSPEGDRLATAGWDSTALFWNISHLAENASAAGHTTALPTPSPPRSARGFAGGAVLVLVLVVAASVLWRRWRWCCWWWRQRLRRSASRRGAACPDRLSLSGDSASSSSSLGGPQAGEGGGGGGEAVALLSTVASGGGSESGAAGGGGGRSSGQGSAVDGFYVESFSTCGSTAEVRLPAGGGVEGPSDPALAAWVWVRRVGSGAFGVVHLGRLPCGREVAVKEEFPTDRKGVKEAVEVLALMRRLRHPHLTEMLDVVYDPRERRLCVLLEYVAGGCLGQHVRGLGHRLQEARAAFYIHQVLQALVFLHANNVVHRDIKGDNILLTCTGVAKLCDYGSLKRLGPAIDLTESESSTPTESTAASVPVNTQVGTPNWMAPEVVAFGTGFCRAGTPADIYSLGCTVSEVLNMGVPPGPKACANVWAAIEHVQVHPPENVVTGVSQAASCFIQQCMARDPADRMPANELLEHPFISLWAQSQVVVACTSPPAHTMQLAQGEMAECAKLRPAIGKGSFGVVYLGLLKGGARHVAVKVVQLGASHSWKARMKAEQEFRLLGALHHAHIVQYLGHMWRDASCLEIFMEYMPGGSVKGLLRARQAALDSATVRAYTRQVLLGLAYLHSGEHGRAAVAHRDVKADNLLLTVDAQVKLSDFGCSKLFDDGGDTGGSFGAFGAHTHVGTPFWMAPEVLQQDGAAREYGTRCDIWSLGCTVIEMLGQTPWRDQQSEAAHETLLRMINSDGRPETPDATPPDLADLLACCLVRNPSLRPSATELLRHPAVHTP